MKGFALAPPRVEIDADLSWLLRSAFAHMPSASPPHNPARALQMARETEVSGRIAKRFEPFARTPMLQPLRNALNEDYHANVAKEALLAQAWNRIAKLAKSRGIPIIAAKFTALRLSGVVAPGTREASDVDVLLRKSDAKAFWQALLDAGFQRTRTHGYAHQLEALIDACGAPADLHIHLPGVLVEKGGFATAEQLIARGLVSETSSIYLVPSFPLLAAHAIAHALTQNRSTPQTYSPLRMVADIMDLRRAQPDVVSSAAGFLAPELEHLCGALERLCVSLSEGEFGPDFEGSLEQSLLWHCVAARLDPEYSQRLRAGGLRDKLRDGSSPLEVVRYLADLLYPSSPAMDVLYGPAVSPWARVRRRLFRPLDLMVRAARHWNL